MDAMTYYLPPAPRRVVRGQRTGNECMDGMNAWNGFVSIYADRQKTTCGASSFRIGSDRLDTTDDGGRGDETTVETNEDHRSNSNETTVKIKSQRITHR